MPVPILTDVKIKPDGDQIAVSLEFPDTMLLCSYTLDVRETNSDKSIPGFPKKGDNRNGQDDTYLLPLPASSNIGRTLWAIITVIDETGQRGEYCANMIIKQGEKRKGLLTTGKKVIEGNCVDETLVALFIKCER